MNEKKFPKFINISPYGKDLFESKSQQRTATSIAGHIKEETGPLKLIGLDGEYGSGKSNVISIVSKELSETHHVFIYEAWSHQEDLQRRSFLEELTEFLLAKGALKSKAWKKDLESLLAKKKATVTRTVPRLSPAIIVSVLLLTSGPLVNALVSVTSAPWEKKLLGFLPYLIALVTWVIAILWDKKYLNPANLFYLYKEQELEKTVNEVISEKEPSVTEFRKWIERLSADLNKDVIIVFDNMDRLPVEKVQILWSLVHTFFSEHHYNRIFVIVPFDRGKLREVFDKAGASDQDKTRNFIEKTFAVLFTVAPPVLTDWKNFFRAKYTEAFGDKENGEYNFVKNIFDLYEARITPRKIISFLNDLVAVKLTWKDEIPLRYIALFVLNKEQIAIDPFKEILAGTYVNNAKYLFKSDDALLDYVAALAYNIPVATARQVTVSRQILLWVRDVNVSELLEISSFGNFWDIADQVFSKEDIDIVPAAASLQGLDQALNKEKNNVIIADIWNALVERQTSLPIDEQALTKTHKILLENAGQSKLQKLVEYMLGQFAISRNFKGETYFQALDDLDRYIKEKGIVITLQPFIKEKALLPEAFIAYIVAAKDKYAYFKVSCDDKALDLYLAGKVSEGFLGTEILPYVINKYAFPMLGAEIENIIKSEKMGSGDIDKVFTTYKIISRSAGTLPLKIPDQSIVALFALIDDDSPGYFELSAMRLARGTDFQGSNGPVKLVNPPTDPAFVEEVADRIEYYLPFGDILKRSLQFPTPLLLAVAKKLVEDGAKGWELEIGEILPLFERIANAIGTTDQQLFTALSRWSGQFQTQLTTSNIQVLIPGLRILWASVAVKSELSAVIQGTALQFVEDQNTEVYRGWFADESSYGFQLLNFFLGASLLPQIPNKLLEAYKESLVAIARATTDQPTGHSEAWQEIYRRTDKRHTAGTIKNIRDAFLSEVNITAGKFLFFEELLRNQGSLVDKAGDSTRRLLTPVVADTLCLERIIEHKDFYLGVVSRAGDDLFDFIKKVRKYIEQNPDNEAISSFSRDLDNLLVPRIVFHKARYFSEDQSEDVTEAVRKKVQSDGNLHFRIGNDLASRDLLPGEVKKLEVEYEFDGAKVHGTVDEHEWLNVPFD
jgi:KAP family P-loop domain